MNRQTSTEEMPSPSQSSPLDRIEQQAKFDKLWDTIYLSTLLCGMAVMLTGFSVYFLSDFKDCDGRSPYGQASLSALYTFALCAHLWIYANHLLSAIRDFEVPGSLNPQARQRRGRRIPVLLVIVASGQFYAATAFALSAYRTFVAPWGLLALVPIAAALGAYVHFLNAAVQSTKRLRTVQDLMHSSRSHEHPASHVRPPDSRIQ